MENSHIVHEVGTREDTNGPWMVIMRRRNGTKKDSRSNPTTMQTQLGMSGTSTSSAEGKKHDKLPVGSSNVSNSEGKRKASVAWAFTDGPIGGKVGLSDFKGPSPKELSICDSLTKVAVSPNLGNTKSRGGPTFIKGKKVLAQGRTNPNLTKSVVL